MNEPAYDIVVVGAHPDDVEIACGGTLAKLSKQGYRVGIIDLTNGEPTPLCNDPEIRLREAEAAANMLGVTRKVLELPNRKLFDSFEARLLLATEFRRMRPRLVIGFGAKTPLASPDHYQAMLITDAAVFYSRLTKWDEQFQHTPPHAIAAQVYFHLGYDPAPRFESGTTLTVDISDHLQQKIDAILCYETQFPPEKQQTLHRVRSQAFAVGAAAGFEAGEIFHTTRALGCQDLLKTVLP
jgi:N-acetylglucosamine malate deacetylase 1